MPAIAAAVLAVFLLELDHLPDAIRLYEHGQYEQAAGLLGRMTSQGQRAAEVYLWLGKSWLRLRKWDEAVASLEGAVALQSGDATCRLWLGRAYGEKASRASVFSAFGLARKVLREFETAVRLSPDNMDARFDLLQYYLQAPGIVGGGKGKAQAEIREIAARNARLGYSARAAMYEHDSDWARCRAELVQSTREFPKDAGAFADLAEFLMKRRDFAGAASAAATAIGLDPNRKSASLFLAAASVQLNRDIPKAEAVLKQLVSGALGDDDPRFSDVYFWLGEAYSALARPAEARQAFEKALRYDPEHSAAKAALAGAS